MPLTCNHFYSPSATCSTVNSGLQLKLLPYAGVRDAILDSSTLLGNKWKCAYKMAWGDFLATHIIHSLLLFLYL